MSTSRPQRAAKASMKTYTEDDSDIEDPMGGVSDDNEAKIHSGLPRKRPTYSSRTAKRQETVSDFRDKTTSSASSPRNSARGSKLKAVKGSKVAGRLEAFKNMPLDILANILSHTEPLTIIRFARVSKGIREILLNKSCSHIWRDARIRSGIPELEAKDITDRQLLGLVYDKACHGRGCQRVNVQEIHWEYSGRLCSVCRADAESNPFSQRDTHVDHFHPRAEECSLVGVGSGHRKPRGIAKRSEELYALEKAALESNTSHTTAVSKYIQQRTTLKKQILADAQRLTEWEIKQAKVKHEQEIERRNARLTSIREKLYGLGWTDSTLGIEWERTKEANQDRPLTEHIWKRIQHPLVEFLNKDLAERRNAAREARERIRRHYLQKDYYDKMSARNEILFPSFNVFAEWSVILPFWKEAEDAALSGDVRESFYVVQLDAVVWERCLPKVQTEVKKYMDDVRRIALERVKAVYDRKGLRLPSDPFESVTSHFRLKVDQLPRLGAYKTPDDVVLPFPQIHERMREIENTRVPRDSDWGYWSRPVEFMLRDDVVPDPLP